ncbi:MFS transporter, NHS family, nucleoside permease/MFS transporter, NHS family, xanthosine permease [Algoriella xinjiangensis]|uniref:MFS transporter, NHS family, nucleoside permease/MFS transporter, NHS family, xanthosine permease n=1 Tax=Algoriella xinjiangensis TaxID=684065 RepID=A0A1I4UWB6_9FLAO|nr:MFS transporter [Algoriella xinjiangensis]SFM93198.1 MFS transporter, NHS family, nucleoside permease/MFS transporter, NHS family, xanthosine permease [Algoriella xinjiangensis]VDH18132.1 Nucleoside-transport system protein nupG [Algoriella xinjiangensis]
MSVKLRLTIMSFLEFAVWGAYLTSMGNYLGSVGLGPKIGLFYAMQGIVSIFMPAIMGIVADRWIPVQRLLGLNHLLAAIFMFATGYYGYTAGDNVDFTTIFTLYSISVAFFMPTIALSNSTAYTILKQNNLDTIKAFPPIRTFGTVGFIVAMLFVNFSGFKDGAFTFNFSSDPTFVSFQSDYFQFFVSGVLGVILFLFSFVLPNCAINKSSEKQSISDAFGLKAFALFKDRKMAIFFVFSMLLGVSLQITNGYANPFITTFKDVPAYANTWGASNANALISLSQVSETLCILLIPFFLKRFGIKIVMLMAMIGWVLRFGLFGLGDPGSGVWMFVLSMIVYGIAFDFFNVSGSLYVDKETNEEIRSSAQGVFMMMTNGFGATIGMLIAQYIVNHYVYSHPNDLEMQLEGWRHSWFIFAGYALVVTILFAIIFKYKHNPNELDEIKH